MQSKSDYVRRSRKRVNFLSGCEDKVTNVRGETGAITTNLADFERIINGASHATLCS